MRRLIVSLPDAGEVAYPLTDNVITVGRTGSNKIQINHPSVSAHHAKLSFVNGQYRLKDLDSTNKTFIRGVPISETVLAGHLPIRFGKVECRYEEAVSGDPSNPISIPVPVAVPVRAVTAESSGRETESLRKELSKLRTERTEIEARLEAEQKKVVALTVQSQTARQTETQLSSILADTKKQLDSVTAEREKLRQENTKNSEKIESFKKQSRALGPESEAARMKAELLARQREAELARKTSELTELQASMALITRERDAAANERNEVARKLKELQEQSALVLAQNEEAQRRIQELSRSSAATDGTSASAVAELNGKLETLKKERDSLKLERDKLTAQAEDLRSKLGNIEAEKLAAGQQQSASAKELGVLGKQIEVLTGEQATSRKTIAELTAKLAVAEAGIADLTGKLAQAEKSAAAGTSAYSKLEGERDGLLKKIAALDGQLAELSAKLQEKANESKAVAELNEKLNAANVALKASTKERDQFGSRLQETEQRAGTLQKQCDELAGECKTIRKQLDRQNSEAEGALKAKAALEKRLAETLELLAQVEKRAGESEMALKKSASTSDEASHKLADYQARVANADKEINAARKESIEIAAKLELELEKSAAVAQERETFRAECESLRKKIQELETRQTASAVPATPKVAETAGKGVYSAPVPAAQPPAVPPLKRSAPLKPVPAAASQPAQAPAATSAHGSTRMRLAPAPSVPASQPAVAAKPAVKASAAPASDAGPDDAFFKGITENLGQMRTQVQNLIRRPSDAKLLAEFFKQLHGLSEKTADNPSVRNFNQLAQVVEALVGELMGSSDRVTSSVLRTVSQSVDVLALLVDPKKRGKVSMAFPTVFLVESEIETQKQIATAVESIHLSLSATDNPHSALSLLDAKRHDLVLINVELPDMNGVELCSRVRLLPSYKKTPLLLLTGAPSVGSWAQWSLNGANDFITKPIQEGEFAVKALAWALRGQINNA